MATLNYDVGRTGMVWPSAFTRAEAAIPINGLVWMGTAADMREQIDEKLARGFRCIKLKIGAIDFAEELQLLKYVRKHYPPDVIEIRVDANGAFHPADAMRKLDQLAPFALHSIEQPIKAGQWEAMASLCANTPVPIALDEELIGLQDPVQQAAMMGLIKPQGIVLKPSFLGDFYASDHWITLAETSDCIWWITSALESNVGLNAIAQYAYLRLNEQYQGLGTGQLYTNNIDSPLHIMSGALHYRPDAHWKFSALP
jgi:L-alanine-DL-glutamate epimerase-like enolase superfamily enzyme